MANIVHLLIVAGLAHSGASQIIGCGGQQCGSSQYCKNETCVPKLPLGEICTDQEQCAAVYSDCLGEDEVKTCQCGSLWVEGPNQACILTCASDCPRNSFCSDIWHGCLPKTLLNDRCDIEENALQCKTEYAVCQGEVGSERCVCDLREQAGSCIPNCTEVPSFCRPELEFCDVSGECLMKKSLGETCSNLNECMTLNSECIGELCNCKVGFQNHLNISCMPECINNEDCTRGGEYCNKDKKYCMPRANLGQPCDSGSDDPCYTPNAACDGDICRCPDPYHDSNNQCILFCDNDNDCQQPTTEFCNLDANVCERKRLLGEQCSAEGRNNECIDDKNGTNVICNNNHRCSCSNEYYQSGGTCLVKCTSSVDCNDDTEFCDSGKCTPKVDLNGLCKPPPAENPCKTNNAQCDPGTNLCSCITSHVESSGACVLKCVTNANCTSQPDQFCNSMTGACEMKPILNQVCTPDIPHEQCKDSNAACIEDEGTFKCSCRDTFAENNAICVATCESSETCGVMYCDKNGIPPICRPKSSLGQDCGYEDQCGHDFAECGADNKCSCTSDYYNYHNGKCLKKCSPGEGCLSTQFCREDGQCEKKKPLGGECSQGDQCKTESATCDTICQCPITHWTQNNSACIEKCTKENTVCNPELEFCDATNYKCQNKAGHNQTCLATDDPMNQCLGKLILCTSPPNSSSRKCLCVDNAEKASVGCSCSDNYVESHDVLRCLKEASKIGDDCDEVQQCYSLAPAPGENSTECSSDKKCSCKTDYVGNSLETKCLKKVTELLQPCEDNTQCKGIGDGNTGAECRTGQCSCLATFVPNEGKVKCLKVASQVEDPCVEHQQCFSLGEEIECKDEKCKCKTGFMGSADGKQCVKSGNGGTKMGPFVPLTIIAAVVIKYFSF